MHRRRREDGEMDLVSPQRQDEEERDRGVLLHHLQVARRPRQMPRQGDEGPAPRQDDEPEGDAVRRQAHDLWRGQGDCGGGGAVSLTLHFPPLSSFCHKALIALFENDTPLTPQIVNLQDEGERSAFRKLWPIGKFPVLRDDARDRTVPESSIIIEYLDQNYPGKTKFIPADADLARRTRFGDRFFDLHLHMQMQKIVGDRLRPAGRKDPHGVEEARALMATALGMLERDMATNTWAAGEMFTLADCAAAPALFYADKITPLAGAYPTVTAYLGRLTQRPSYARALKEAEPYFKYFPKE